MRHQPPGPKALLVQQPVSSEPLSAPGGSASVQPAPPPPSNHTCQLARDRRCSAPLGPKRRFLCEPQPCIFHRRASGGAAEHLVNGHRRSQKRCRRSQHPPHPRFLGRRFNAPRGPVPLMKHRVRKHTAVAPCPPAIRLAATSSACGVVPPKRRFSSGPQPRGLRRR